MLRYIDGKHAFSKYETELKELIDTLNTMRAMVLDQYAILHDLLEEGKAEQSTAKKEVRSIDGGINALQIQLEKKAHAILSRYDLHSTELRLVLSIIKLAAILERMGDHCKNSVKRAWRIDSKISPQLRHEILDLFVAAGKILDELEPALLRFDENKALAALKYDDTVDKLYKDLVLHISSSNSANPIPDEAVSNFLFIIKNLERMADQANDIIMEVYYIHNGKRWLWRTED